MLREPVENRSLAQLPRVGAVFLPDDLVAERAYEKFVASGCAHGFDQENWFAAQREMLAEAFG